MSTPDEGATPTPASAVFLCYRQDDGADLASWLFEALDGFEAAPPHDTGSPSCRLSVYYDHAAPAYEDWKTFHMGHLRTAKALLFIATPGAKTDFREDGDEDFVHEELDWWLSGRSMAPIIITRPGHGGRYVPAKIRDRWPDAQRIEIDPAQMQTMEAGDSERLRERLIGRIAVAITTSLDDVRFDELEKAEESARRSRRKSITVALATSAAIAAGLIAWQMNDVAERTAQEAFATQLVAHAANMPAIGVRDRERKALFALESIRRLEELGMPTVEADVALRDAIRFYPRAHRRYESENSGVRALSFSGDGQRVLAVIGGELHSWGLEGEGELRLMPTPRGPAAFSIDGKYLAVVRYAQYSDGEITIFEVDEERRIGLIPFDQGRVERLRVSPQGRFVTMMLGRAGYVWRVEDGRQLHAFERVDDMAFTPDGAFLAVVSGSGGNEHGLWRLPVEGDPPTLERIGDSSLLVDAVRVRFARESPVAYVVKTSRGGGVVDLIRVRGSSQNLPLRREGTVPLSGFPIAIGPTAQLLAVRDARRFQWTEVTDRSNGSLVRLPFYSEELAFGPDGRFMAYSAGRSVVDVVELTRSMEPLKATVENPARGGRGSSHAMAFSPDGRLITLAFAAGDSARAVVQTWSPETGQQVLAERREFKIGPPSQGGEPDFAAKATIDPTGRFVAIAAHGAAVVWDVTRNERAAEARFAGEAIRLLLDGDSWLLVADEVEVLGPATRGGPNERHTGTVYDLATGEPLALNGHGILVESSAREPSVAPADSVSRPGVAELERAVRARRSDDRFGFAVSDDGFVSVRDMSRGEEEVARLYVGEDWMGASFAIDDDVRFLAAAQSNDIRFWNLDIYDMACELLDRQSLSGEEWREVTDEDRREAAGEDEPPVTCLRDAG